MEVYGGSDPNCAAIPIEIKVPVGGDEVSVGVKVNPGIPFFSPPCAAVEVKAPRC